LRSSIERALTKARGSFASQAFGAFPFTVAGEYFQL
jgi:hypothetical protein